MDYQIVYLADHPEYAENVAEQTYKLWGRPIFEDTGISTAQFVDVIRSRAVKDAVPLTLVALASGRFVGTVSMKQYEAKTAEGLSPGLVGCLLMRLGARMAWAVPC